MSLLGPLPFTPLFSDSMWSRFPILLPPLPVAFEIPEPISCALSRQTAMDLIDNKKEGKLVAFLPNPGVPLENIEVTLAGNNLIIQGGALQTKNSPQDHQRNQKSFCYMQSINTPIDLKHIEKGFSEDGQMLIITLKKKK